MKILLASGMCSFLITAGSGQTKRMEAQCWAPLKRDRSGFHRFKGVTQFFLHPSRGTSGRRTPVPAPGTHTFLSSQLRLLGPGGPPSGGDGATSSSLLSGQPLCFGLSGGSPRCGAKGGAGEGNFQGHIGSPCTGWRPPALALAVRPKLGSGSEVKR